MEREAMTTNETGPKYAAWRRFFAAIAPVLTFIGSLVTAWLTYLATVAAKK